jgi:hypothetical protein
MATIQQNRQVMEILKEMSLERDDHNVTASWLNGILVLHFKSPAFAHQFRMALDQHDIECLTNIEEGGKSTVAIQ